MKTALILNPKQEVKTLIENPNGSEYGSHLRSAIHNNNYFYIQHGDQIIKYDTTGSIVDKIHSGWKSEESNMGGDGLVFDAKESTIAVGYTKSRQGGSTHALTWSITKNGNGEWIKSSAVSAGHEARSIKLLDEENYILIGDSSGHTKARIAKYSISKENRVTEQWTSEYGSGGSHQDNIA